jgi:outer membrane protein
MKNIYLFAGAVVLSVMLLTSACNQGANKNTPAAATSNTPVVNGSGKMAYVNIDTLENNYELLKTRREEFNKRQEQMKAELQHSYEQMQADAENIQKKAQANTLTQSEYEAAQQRIGKMQHSLETRQQALTEQLMKEQNDLNQDLKKRLDAFLTEYNKTKNYDYIFSYSASGSAIMFANKTLDITKDVVDGMNAAAKNEAAAK